DGPPGDCSLREAIEAANLHPGPDTIQFAVAGSIQLRRPLVLTDSGTEIDGPAARVAVDGSSLQGSRSAFLVLAAHTVFRGFNIRTEAVTGIDVHVPGLLDG